MSDQSNSSPEPKTIDDNENSEASEGFFKNAEFDGLERGAPVADFGLPMNLDSISVKRTNEFEAVREVTRNIAALDISQFVTETADSMKSSSAEFELGATFNPNVAIFASKQESSESIEMAPPLPFFLQPARTSFRTEKELSELRSDLERAFAHCSLSFAHLEKEACGYSCSALRQLTLIGIEVHIFGSGSGLLVEMRQMSGCRYAYGEVTDLIAEALQVTYTEPSCNLPPCPPDLSDEELSGMPLLKREASCEVRCNEEVCTCEYAMQLVCEGVPKSIMLQGLRAIGTLIDNLTSAMNSCSHCGACGAHHYNHAKLFSEDGHWMRLAERVGHLANSEDEDVRTVAMAAVANISTLKDVCGKWLESNIPTLVAGAQSDEPHLRREALRTIQAMASRDKVLAAKLVRAGVVSALELEAAGGEDSQSPDDAMQSFAEEALHACRSGP